LYVSLANAGQFDQNRVEYDRSEIELFFLSDVEWQQELPPLRRLHSMIMLRVATALFLPPSVLQLLFGVAVLKCKDV